MPRDSSQVATAAGYRDRRSSAQIDTMHLGRDRVIARPPGPRRADRRPRPGVGARRTARGARRARRGRLLLTHIHLDHAGATGALVRRLPGPARLRERGRAPRTWSTPRSSWRAPGASTGRRTWTGSGARWRRFRQRTWSRWRAGRRSRASGSSTCPATRATTSAGSTSPRATRTSATWPGCGSRRATSTMRADPAAGDRRRGVARSIDRIGALGPERLRLTHFGVAEDAGASSTRVRRGSAVQARRRARRGDRERSWRVRRADRRRRRPRDGARPAPGDALRSSSGWGSSGTGASGEATARA